MRTLLVTLTTCLVVLPAHARYSGGSGTVQDPYQIATAADLLALGETPNDYDKHFILTADIDLNPNLAGRKVFDRAVIAPSVRGRGREFWGTLDGRNHRILNMNISGEDRLGLFGTLCGSVFDLRLDGVKIVGSGSFVGGLAGSNNGSVANGFSTGSVAGWTEVGGLVGFNGGDIRGCSSAGAVTSKGGFVGGLVGHNDFGTVSASYSACAVTSAADFAGGLVGYNGDYVIGCYSTGTVTGGEDADGLGGLVGHNDGGLVSSCYSTSTVTGVWDIGGLVGWNEDGAVTNSYSAGRVTGEAYVGGLVGTNEGYGDYGSIANCYSIAVATGQDSVGGLVGGSYRAIVTQSFWEIAASGCTKSEGGTGLEASQMRDARTYLNAGWDFLGESANGTHEIWQMANGKYPVLSILNGYQPPRLAGEGSPDAPYVIYTAAELGAVLWHNPRACYRLGANIDLSGIRWSTSVIPWFLGTFDGNNRTVRHLTIVGARYLGLFGVVVSPLIGDGRITDLGVTDVNIIGSGSRVGALAGYNHSTVSTCYSTGSIAGSGALVGGLIGSNYGTVTRCHGAGAVTGGDRVGGLVGYNGGDMTRCYDSGSVSGGSRIGGLAGGNSGTVANSYSTGTVASTAGPGGGLVGDSRGHVIDCYSTGAVTGSSGVGGLVGRNTGSVEDAFWDIQTSACVDSAAGTGKTTADMQTAATFLKAGWDFAGEFENGTDEIWQMQDGVEYPSFLPRLKGKGTAEEPYLISTAAELCAIAPDDEEACYRLTANIDLSGRMWSRAVIPQSDGIFDGNNLTIHNLTIAAGSEFSWGVGLIGWLYSDGQVKNLRVVDVNVTSSGSPLGALVGWNWGTVSNCHSSGIVTGTSDVGGLVGSSIGDVIDCSSIGSVTCNSNADDQWLAGGLIGSGGDSVIRCRSGGTVTGHWYVGGLVGGNDGDVTQCCSDSTVTGHSQVGGLAGANAGGITQCWCTATVRGEQDVGGLVGRGYDGSTISNCHSAGMVRGDRRVGGLVGEIDMCQVLNCWSAGIVQGQERVGGLIGNELWRWAWNCFWDTQASGCTSSDGGTGKTTAEMQTAGTFLAARWDFVGETANGTEDIWWILEGKDYPRLWWEAAKK